MRPRSYSRFTGGRAGGSVQPPEIAACRRSLLCRPVSCLCRANLAARSVSLSFASSYHARSQSLAGVGFTRNPANGAYALYVDYLTNTQGEDVVAGRRRSTDIADLERRAPDAYRALVAAQSVRLFLLQARTGKRTPLISDDRDRSVGSGHGVWQSGPRFQRCVERADFWSIRAIEEF